MDIRASLEKAYDASIQEQNDNTTVEVAPDAVDAPAVDTPPEDVQEPSEGRDRDEKGRFKAKGTEEPQQATEQPVETPKEDVAVKPNEQGEEAPKSALNIKPPVSWTAAEKAAFDKAPDEVKLAFARRQAESDKAIQQRFQEVAEVKRRYAAIDELIEPRKQAWALDGMSEAQALNQLLSLSDYAANSPVEFIKFFASRSGIDLAALQQDAALNPVDPRVLQLERQLQEQQEYILRQQQAEQRAHNEGITGTIAQFRDAVDEHGLPKYPHFDSVRQHMAGLISTGAAETLEDAYNQAVWARPDLRDEFLSDERKRIEAEFEAKRAEEAKQKAIQAQKAAVSVKTSPGNAAEPKNHGSIRSALEAAYSKYER